MRTRALTLTTLDRLGIDTGKQETNRAILIRLLNPSQIARRDGTLSAMAQHIAPATVEARVFDDTVDKLTEVLRSQNIDAEVTVVEPTNWEVASPSKHIWQDIGIGLGMVGIVALVWRLVNGGKK